MVKKQNPRHNEVRKLIADGKSRKEVCEITGYSKQNISLIVGPKTWQKALGLGAATGMSKTEWKNKLKARAAELFPNVDVTLWNADALLIYDAATRRAIN